MKTKLFTIAMMVALLLAAITRGQAQEYDGPCLPPTHGLDDHQSAFCGLMQTIALSAGTNWVSFYVDTDLDALKAALETTGLSPISIQSKNNGKTTYAGSRWRGALNALDFAQMYKIEVPEDYEISLEGMPLDASQITITIKTGDNWIAFPFQQSMTVTELFTDFPVAGDVVRSKDDGQANYTNRWRGALSNLVPGQGYIYKSATTEERTFTFPTSAK